MNRPIVVSEIRVEILNRNHDSLQRFLYQLDADPQCTHDPPGKFFFYLKALAVMDVPWDPKEEGERRPGTSTEESGASNVSTGARSQVTEDQGPSCPICFERYMSPVDGPGCNPAVTTCGHIMCVSYIMKAVTIERRKNCCPFFRSELLQSPWVEAERYEEEIAELLRAENGDGPAFKSDLDLFANTDNGGFGDDHELGSDIELSP